MLAVFDAVSLARMQFAFTISFHFIFPAFSIGLASYLAVLEGLWLRSKKHVYLQLFEFWKKVFAVAFGMGVVSGLVMSYQFGTNWAVFSDKAGPVIGPLMGYEVFTAFFLEAGFLGVMLFGLERVGKRMHFFATLMVALGTVISASWILVVNSWMQTPTGYGVNAVGQFIPADWMAVIFNPSLPYRFVHTVMGAYLTTAFFVGGVGAYHLLHNNADKAARVMFSMAMWMAALVAPLQIIAGDLHGINTLEYQPAKIAAMEGDYNSDPGSSLILFGVPDDQAEVTRYQLAIPHVGALILTHNYNGVIKGLKDFPKADRPPAQIVFWSFRIMVGLGLAMFGLGLWSLLLRLKRDGLYRNKLFLGSAVALAPSGFIAVLAGWTTTEVGRQPFTIYGLLRTADSISPVAAPVIAASLLTFVVTYFIVFGFGIFYILRLCSKPVHNDEPELDMGPLRVAAMTTEVGGEHGL